MVRPALLVILFLLTACDDGSVDESGTGLTGEELAVDVGCLTCHTDTDTDVAPSLEGSWGSQVTLTDGRSVTVDEVYVRRAITDPGTDVVDGYGPTMPPVPLDEADVDQLVEWVRSLG
jgi:cytochrome c oxidase subunit 2